MGEHPEDTTSHEYTDSRIYLQCLENPYCNEDFKECMTSEAPDTGYNQCFFDVQFSFGKEMAAMIDVFKTPPYIEDNSDNANIA